VLLWAAKAEVQLGQVQTTCDWSRTSVALAREQHGHGAQVCIPEICNSVQCDQALRLTLQLIKANSSDAEAYCIRGLALFLRCFSHCLRHFPVVFYIPLHDSYDFDQALKHLKEALRLDPDLPAAQQAFKRTRAVQVPSVQGLQAREACSRYRVRYA
jgi:tetratricopeptide (TPR) repeat protein